MIRFSILAIVLFLAACSTSPVQQINYFLLSGASTTETRSQLSSSTKIPVFIQEIRLAEYLSQSNLAMQLASNQIYYSRQHAWAERLEAGIEKALLQDLNSSPHFHYSTEAPVDASSTLGLIIQFDHFVATDKSNVIASGSYWITGGSKASSTDQIMFNITTTLDRDGYAHAVEKMRFLVTKLSEQIEQDVQAHKV